MAFYCEDKEIIISEWVADDVQTVRPDLDRDQSLEVLHAVAHDFDANIGINWDVITWTADNLFPEETK